MSGRTVELLRLGRRALQPTASRALRRAAVTVASMSVVLASCVLVLLWAGSEESSRQDRSIASALDALGGRHAQSYLGAVDHHPVTVVDIYSPGSEQMPPPELGLRKYPGVGEAVVSPRLRNLSGPKGGDHFGQVVGEIAESGLTGPDELRVYVGRGSALASPPSGIALQPPASFLYSTPLSQKMLGVAGLWLFPSLIAVVAAVAVGGRAEAQREHILTVLGARSWDRVKVHAAEDLLPLGIGIALASPIAWLLAGPGVTLPLLDLQVGGSLPRRGLPVYLVAIMGAGAACFVVLQVGRRFTRRGHRHRRGLPMRQALAFVVVVLGVAWLPALVSAAPPLPTLVYLVGLIAAVLLLPALLVVLTSVLGDVILAVGPSRGRASALLAGRSLQAQAIQIGRTCAVVGVLVVILGQAQLWSNALGAQYFEAKATQVELGEKVLAADRSLHSPTVWHSLSSEFDPSVGVVMMSSDLPESPGDAAPIKARLEGSCAALEALGLTCSEGTVPRDDVPQAVGELMRWVLPGEELSVSPTPPSEAPQHNAEGRALLVSLDGTPLDMARANRLSWALTSPGVTFEPLGESWIVPATVLKEQAVMSIVLALCGLLVLATAVSSVAVTQALSTSADLIPLTAMSGRSGGWLVGVFLLRCALPLTLSALLGALAYLVMPTALRAGQSTVAPSIALAGLAVLVTATIGCAQAFWAGRSTATQAASWRPDAVPRR